MESTNFPLQDVLMVCEVCRLAWLALSMECVYTIWPTEWYSFVIHILETNCCVFCSGQGFSQWVVCVWLHWQFPIVLLHEIHTQTHMQYLFTIHTGCWVGLFPFMKRLFYCCLEMHFVWNRSLMSVSTILYSSHTLSNDKKPTLNSDDIWICSV